MNILVSIYISLDIRVQITSNKENTLDINKVKHLK